MTVNQALINFYRPRITAIENYYTRSSAHGYVPVTALGEIMQRIIPVTATGDSFNTLPVCLPFRNSLHEEGNGVSGRSNINKALQQ